MKRELADLTSKTPRGRVFQAVLQRFRKKRTTPRPDLLPELRIFEDPAPDWVERVARDVLEHTEFERDHGSMLLEQALLWCQFGGRPEARAEIILTGETRPTTGRAENQRYLVRLIAILNQKR